MPYYTKVLRPDETLHMLGRLHWLIFLPGALLLLLGLALGITAMNQTLDSAPYYICAASALLFIFWGIVSLLRAVILRATTEIAVTDRRVIFKRGLIRRTTVEMNTSKIETVDVIQGILGRMFDYGTVIIRGTGSGIEPLRHIAHPLELRNSIVVG